MWSVPGNHDARNVGYVHFEELIGPRHWAQDVGNVRIVGADTSEPDLDEGQIGRERYPWLEEQFAVPAELKMLVIHHHLISLPGTGRERNIVDDAGDLLELLITNGVQLVLTGHKHVPYVWRLEDMYIANAGTCSSLRLRGHTRPCYNVMEFDGDEVKILRRYPFGAQTLVAHWSLSTGRAALPRARHADASRHGGSDPRGLSLTGTTGRAHLRDQASSCSSTVSTTHP